MNLTSIFGSNAHCAAVCAFVLAPAALGHNDVVFPDGGETFQVGERITIEWTVTIEHDLDGWDVFYSTTGNQGPWTPIAIGLPPGDPAEGSQHLLDWTVPDEVTAAGSIRVRMNGTGGGTWEDTSAADFTIEPSLGARGCAGQVANSTGAASTLHLLGSAVAADNALTLAVVDLPADVFGFALNSDVLDSVPLAGGSQGTLCLGGTIGRHITQVTSSQAAGYVAMSLELTAIPRGGVTVSAMAGETYSFQWWHRDLNPSATSNFSDVVTVQLQ